MSKKLQISFAESAVTDLEEIREYYTGQHVPEVGDRFVRESIALIEDLPSHPDRGRVVSEFNQSKLRELIHPPFRIVYRRDPQRLSIVRVWRSERLLRLPWPSKVQDSGNSDRAICWEIFRYPGKISALL
jgi:toxin ParE1/3/4